MAGTARERLIEAGMAQFYQHGFHAVGLDRILAEVGVTKTTFYNHFESKEDLVLAVLEDRDKRVLEEWTTTMEERAPGDPAAQLLVMFDIMDEWFKEPDFRGCMFINAAVEFPSPHDPIREAAADHCRHLYEMVLDRARKAGASDPEGLAKQIMILEAGAQLTRHLTIDRSAAETARAAAEALLRLHLPVAAGAAK